MPARDCPTLTFGTVFLSAGPPWISKRSATASTMARSSVRQRNQSLAQAALCTLDRFNFQESGDG